MALADLVAADYAAQLRSFGAGAQGRYVAEVSGLLVVSLGVDEPWGLQVVATHVDAEPADVDAAVGWCRSRGREPQVVVRSRDAGRLSTYAVVDELPALVAPAGGEQTTLDITIARDLEQFRLIYSAAFEMRRAVADRLVAPADLVAHPHLIGRVGNRVVACAQVRPHGRLAFVNGVGVLPTERGRGYGEAMMTACRAQAAVHGCELVWLNASPASLGFYEAIGFELVDTHLALAAPASSQT